MSDEEYGPKHTLFLEKVRPLLDEVTKILDDNDMGYLFMTATDLVEREGEYSFMSHCATNCRMPHQDPGDEFGNAPETVPMAYYTVYPSGSAGIDLRILKHALGMFLERMSEVGDMSQLTITAATLYEMIAVLYEKTAKKGEVPSEKNNFGEAEIIDFPGGNKTLH